MGKTEVAEEGIDEKQGVEKVWTSAIGRAETETDEKEIYAKELKNIAKPKKTEGKTVKRSWTNIFLSLGMRGCSLLKGGE